MGADPRVTSLGRRLRHYRLDELPQLANVVKGEMALLGPRPETPVYVDLDDPRWKAVLQARPGIAGPTQVLIHDFEAGLAITDLKRYEAEMVPVKLAIDQWYLHHASPGVDLLVVIALAERFVLRRTTTHLHRRLEREIPEVSTLLRLHLPASEAVEQPAPVREPSRPPHPLGNGAGRRARETVALTESGTAPARRGRRR
jgi:hypothetical protein